MVRLPGMDVTARNCPFRTVKSMSHEPTPDPSKLPDDPVAGPDDSPPNDQDGDVRAAAYRMYEAQYMNADDLFAGLVRLERLARPQQQFYFEQLNPEDRRELSCALSSAARKTRQWRTRRHNLIGHVREALAAWELYPALPEVAAELEQPWRCARQARSALGGLGPQGEQAAARLLPSWKHTSAELVAVVADLIGQPVPNETHPRRP